MRTVRGVLSILVTGRVAPGWVNFLVGLASLLLVLIAPELWRRKDRLGGDPSIGLRFAAALVVTLITGFNPYVHDLSRLLVAIFLAIGSPQCWWRRHWRTVPNTSVAILYVPLAYLLLGERNRLYLLWLPLFALALASGVLLAKRQEANGQGFLIGGPPTGLGGFGTAR